MAGVGGARWNTAAAESVLVCLVTALGLVRLLGQPRVMGVGALSVDAAHGVYETFLGLREVRWLEEPPPGSISSGDRCSDRTSWAIAMERMPIWPPWP